MQQYELGTKSQMNDIYGYMDAGKLIFFQAKNVININQNMILECIDSGQLWLCVALLFTSTN